MNGSVHYFRKKLKAKSHKSKDAIYKLTIFVTNIIYIDMFYALIILCFLHVTFYGIFQNKFTFNQKINYYLNIRLYLYSCNDGKTLFIARKTELRLGGHAR